VGIGFGGGNPLSPIMTSEFATKKWRGAMKGSVFAMLEPEAKTDPIMAYAQLD
jgi:hypothetical protein